MKSVIRKGVFETNSSSSHSISIAGGDYVPDKIYVDEDGICKIYPGEFGWEVETYYDAATKASYCLTYLKTGGGDGKQEQMLREVILEAIPEAKEIEFVPNEIEDKVLDYEWGYIDHQSHIGDADVCGEAFGSAKLLRDFIFNPKSMLHTDNDNH